MTEMIARLVSAIEIAKRDYWKRGDVMDFGQDVPDEWIARAVVTAMREWTPEMLRIAEASGISFATVQRVWPTMIDAALS